VTDSAGQEAEKQVASSPDPMKRLLVDASPVPIPKAWRIAGLTWALLHILILLFGGDPNALLVSGIAGLVVAAAASLAGVLERPRAHSAGPFALLFGLVMLLSLGLEGLRDPGMLVIQQWLLFLLGFLVTTWLLREKRTVLIVAIALLTVSSILALRATLLDLPASWLFPRDRMESAAPLLAYRFAAYASVQLLIVVTMVPFIIASGKWAAYTAGLPLGLIVYSIASLAFKLPEWLSDTSGESAAWPMVRPVSHYSLLALLLLLITLIHLVKQTLKERKRWAAYGGLTGLLTGSVAAVLLFVVALFILPISSYPWAMNTAGFLLGLGFAAREAIIRLDETRHPRRRPVPLLSWLREANIILRSLGLWIGRGLLFKRLAPPVTPARRIIDSAGTWFHFPYESGRPRWVPVAVHMHTNRWEGAFNAEEMVDHYARIGAGAVILTDHNRVTDSEHSHGAIHGYEHGWGPHNHHVLVLGAERTRTDHYPFGGSTRSRAETLGRLRKISRLLILAHPRSGKAWSGEDVTTLDYDALEIFNKSIDSFEPWDEALTSGLMVWGTAGDDCHDPRSRHQTGKRYLLVDLREGDAVPERQGAADPDAVLEAMRLGRFVAVRHLDRSVTRSLPHEELPMIEHFERSERGYVVSFDRPVNYAEVIGPGGEVVSILKGQKRMALAPAKGRGYCRLVIYHGNHTLALNPVVRLASDSALQKQ